MNLPGPSRVYPIFQRSEKPWMELIKVEADKVWIVQACWKRVGQYTYSNKNTPISLGVGSLTANLDRIILILLWIILISLTCRHTGNYMVEEKKEGKGKEQNPSFSLIGGSEKGWFIRKQGPDCVDELVKWRLGEFWELEEGKGGRGGIKCFRWDCGISWNLTAAGITWYTESQNRDCLS